MITPTCILCSAPFLSHDTRDVVVFDNGTVAHRKCPTPEQREITQREIAKRESEIAKRESEIAKRESAEPEPPPPPRIVCLECMRDCEIVYRGPIDGDIFNSTDARVRCTCGFDQFVKVRATAHKVEVKDRYGHLTTHSIPTPRRDGSIKNPYLLNELEVRVVTQTLAEGLEKRATEMLEAVQAMEAFLGKKLLTR